MNKHKIFLDIAEKIAEMSHCISHKVGCILVKDGRIISTGYNDTCRKEAHCITCTKVGCNKDMAEYETCPAVHAEMNAIISASRKEMIGSTLYLAGLLAGEEYFELDEVYPCEICLRLIKNAGIDKVVTSNGIIYQRDSQGILRRN